MHRARYMWITCTPLAWLLIVTTSQPGRRSFRSSPRIGFLAQADALQRSLETGAVAAAKISEMNTLIFNARLDAVLCGIFIVLVTIIVVDSVRVWAGVLLGTPTLPFRESLVPVPTQLRAEEI